MLFSALETESEEGLTSLWMPCGTRAGGQRCKDDQSKIVSILANQSPLCDEASHAVGIGGLTIARLPGRSFALRKLEYTAGPGRLERI